RHCGRRGRARMRRRRHRGRRDQKETKGKLTGARQRDGGYEFRRRKTLSEPHTFTCAAVFFVRDHFSSFLLTYPAFYDIISTII
ncbi:MAG: hypothetical protein J5585_10480, partial [Clostridia bacterium]|nr:hypothetical protein [Clostridia bacterium]